MYESKQEDSMMVVHGTSSHYSHHYVNVVVHVENGVGDQGATRQKPDPVHKNASGDPINDRMCLDAVGVAPRFYIAKDQRKEER